MKKLFGLGLMLIAIGMAWLVAIITNPQIVSNTAIYTMCLLTSIIMAIGGYIIIFAYFDK